MNAKGRISMNGWMVIGVIAAYFLLVWFVLPRLGVPT